MIGFRSGLALCLGLLVGALAPGSTVSAFEESGEGTAATYSPLDGFENPPNADKNGSGYVNPCLGHEGFEAHVSKPTGLVKSDLDKISVAFDGNVIKFESTSAPGASIGFSVAIDPTFEVQYVEWRQAVYAADARIDFAEVRVGAMGPPAIDSLAQNDPMFTDVTGTRRPFPVNINSMFQDRELYNALRIMNVTRANVRRARQDYSRTARLLREQIEAELNR